MTETRRSKGSTYRVAIRYRYEWPRSEIIAVDARPADPASPESKGYLRQVRFPNTYESVRYDFGSGGTAIGVDALRAAVVAHPSGSVVTCFVDPANPASAVLNRGVPVGVWLGLGFGVALFVGGLGIVGVALQQKWRLFGADGSLAGVLGFACVALLWGCMTSGLLVVTLADFSAESVRSWILVVFLFAGLFLNVSQMLVFLRALRRYRAGPTPSPQLSGR